ncbi:hypothetical protein E1B28_013153 [Marasmius oreades]|uniref:Uncharacterized protein n=1 Tax=Marasmius oreades TaxID=181124 RepID=A0A9P7RPN1_9AGAR|nr:uncharacterized protein E1B28_013153 [Marasmius oreades]KAG7087172.1 hypothetical protein E1B28_013153 [Marasmius oreades]
MLLRIAPAIISSLTFIVVNQFYFSLLISSLAVVPFSHGLQIDVSPTVIAGSFSAVKWTRDLCNDPITFGLVSVSLDGDNESLRYLVSVWAGDVKSGTTRVVFPSLGQTVSVGSSKGNRNRNIPANLTVAGPRKTGIGSKQ